MKVEHIGIAVKDMQNARELYEKLLNTKVYKEEEVASEGVNTVFFKSGDTKIELLEGLTEESAITKFIAKKGEGIHHIAFEVADIEKEIERLIKEGFQVLNKIPKKGADNKLVAFLHPKSCNGVLVELCQEIKA
ncbi:methylmalonyl-CoA epimerase [Spirosomataceae bacterium TFI 002]|nr:methylmalonyl-CoA epimerase [Spirosomataceae bacterium TFI 002]